VKVSSVRKTAALSCLTAASLAALAVFTPGVSAAAGDAKATKLTTPAPSATTPQLPQPTGPYPIGVVNLHLVDSSRPDLYDVPRKYRELMVSVVYPARHAAQYPKAPLMTPGVSAGFNALAGVDNYDVPQGTTIDYAAIRTFERVGAPAARGWFPVVLYSPGLGDVRSWDSVLVDQLASEGHVVVTIDPTYEASAVEFPGGRVASSRLLQLYAQAVADGTQTQFLETVVLGTRVADTKFVLDALARLADGQNPDAEHAPLPAGLGAALDLGRTGMFGHSGGGFTTLEAMYEDPRIKAGINMDGTLEFVFGAPTDTNLSPVAQHGLSKPFLILSSDSADACTAAADPSCAAVLAHSTGWHADITLPGTQHGSLTDAEVVMPQLSGLMTPEEIASDTGSAPTRDVMAQEELLISGFFDTKL
jgi:predicted dienelactone hydrolase